MNIHRVENISHLIGILAGSDINGPVQCYSSHHFITMKADVKSLQTKILMKWLFKIKIFRWIFLFNWSRECSAVKRDLSWNWISKYFNKFQSIEGHNSILQKWKCYNSIISNHNWYAANQHALFSGFFFSTKNLCFWEIKNMRQIQIISFIRVHYHVVFFWGTWLCGNRQQWFSLNLCTFVLIECKVRKKRSVKYNKCLDEREEQYHCFVINVRFMGYWFCCGEVMIKTHHLFSFSTKLRIVKDFFRIVPH